MSPAVAEKESVRLLGRGRHFGVADRIAAGGRVSATARAIGGNAVWHSLAPSLYGREMSVSGPVCVGGLEEREFQGDSPTEEEVAA